MEQKVFCIQIFLQQALYHKLTDISCLAWGFAQVFSFNPKATAASSWFLNDYSAQFIMTVVASTSALLLCHCYAPLRDAMTHTDYPAEIHTTLISHFSSRFLLVDPLN